MAVTPSHTFGWDLEVKIRPILEMILGEELKKTESRYDEIDYVSNTRYVELKGRPEHSVKGYVQAPFSFDSWLIPCDKVENKDKPVTVIYYWEFDKTLWRCDYNKKLWDTFNKGIPDHKTSQMHYWIPREHFKCIWGTPI